MDSDAASIDEAVNFLDRFAPAALAGLRDRMPELRNELQAGGVAGKKEEYLEKRVEVQLTALQALVEECRATTARHDRQLTFAHRLRGTGELTAIIGSSSVLAALASEWRLGGYVSGTVALIGSLTSLAAKYLIRDDADDPKALRQAYVELVGHQARGEVLSRRLLPYKGVSIFKSNYDDVKAVVDETDALYVAAKNLLIRFPR